MGNGYKNVITSNIPYTNVKLNVIDDVILFWDCLMKKYKYV